MNELDVRGLMQECVCSHIKADHHIVKIIGVEVLKCMVCAENGKVCIGFMRKELAVKGLR